MIVTIFTPSFNRGYIIEKLYESLSAQNSNNFEWIIVDDGSSDNTEEIVKGFISQELMPITYIKTTNQGKQQAINCGVKLAKGELFFIVDSDDYLTEDAIELITKYWNKRVPDRLLAGLCFRKVNYTSGEFLGGDSLVEQGNYNSYEINYKLGLFADKAEVFVTDVLRQYPFPQFKGENFVPEALVWNRIAKDYSLYFVNKGIYMCEYLADGLSKNFYKNLCKNTKGFRLFYLEVALNSVMPIIVRLKAFLRYIQCNLILFKKIF